LDKFMAVTKSFPAIPKSLAASAGIFLGHDYHFDMTRTGISLYGADGPPDIGLTPALFWEANILQIRTIKAGENAGYSSLFTASSPRLLATIGAGYADGYARNLYRPDDGVIAQVSIAGYKVPLAGAVSMDLLIVDITDIPEQIREQATTAILFGADYSLSQMAHDRATITYEVMTGLGERVTRLYTGDDKNNSDI